MKKCFFCDIQTLNDNNKIVDNQYFFVRYDDFPLSNGHCEIIPKQHIISFFDLTPDQIKSFYDLIKTIKEIIDNKFKPDGYNIGVNDGKAAGRTQDHLHIHLIPRYKEDGLDTWPKTGYEEGNFPKTYEDLKRLF